MTPHPLDLSAIGKRFGDAEVLREIDLAIRAGEFLSLVGASGCGKSTLLRVIAGLETPDRGTVRIGGTDVTGTDPADRNLAMVFQSYALYPHMTVAENIAAPLRMRQLPLWGRLPVLGRTLPGRAARLAEIGMRVREAAEILQSTPLLGRKPAQLSGGQRQRVALARALVRDPAAFLMDEPLSNLDAKLRVHMRAELTALHRRLGATFVYVTHDQVEAMTMSSRIGLMEQGRILQLGTPAELYQRPANLSVARFIGSPAINLVAVEIDTAGRVHGPAGPMGLGAKLPAGPATLGLRPEDLHPVPGGWRARIETSELHGADRYLTCRLAAEGETTLTLRLHAGTDPGADEGGWLSLGFDTARAHLFAADGRRAETQLAQMVPA